MLDGDQLSALAVVRSLGRVGLQVTLASAEHRPIAGFSRHAHARVRYPSPLADPAGFTQWLANRQRERPTELAIPITERTLVPLMQARSRLDEARLALPSTTALEAVLDKSRTIALAQRLGVAAPASWALPRDTDLATLDSPWGYPVVVKPARSLGQTGALPVQLSVCYAQDARALRQQVQHLWRFGEVLLQEYFAGAGVGVEVICDRGKVLHAFQHRRLHEVPLTGGGSSLRCSEPLVPELLDAARRLLGALDWHGVAMVEFKHRPSSGEYRLMEINGRFWGSLPLATAAGADFPVMLHELMTTGAVRPRPAARTGVLCRHLARDLDWAEHVLREAAPAGLGVLPSRGAVVRDWLSVFSPRHHFDAQAWSDPLPGLVDLARVVGQYHQRLASVLRSRLRLRQERAAAQRAARSLATRATTVLFLCHGNINRSALAQAHARAKGMVGMTFTSAGFHTPAGRPADPVMVQTANEAGIDLSDWASVTLDAAQVAAADLILAMEARHLDQLLAQHPQARGKSFLLGGLGDSGTPEIPDPYGQAPLVYQQVCSRVRASVDAWWPGATRP